MALNHCDGDRFNGPCRTLFAVGLMACPHCKCRDFHEFGSRPEDEDHPMSPKIARTAGPTVADLQAPVPDELEAPDEVPEPETPTERPPSVNAVLDAVAGDPDRAAEALDAENARDTPRKTLVAQLEKILADATDPETDSEVDETADDAQPVG